MPGRPSLKKHIGIIEEAGGVNLIPLMNVFCIIIPFLVMVAVFSPMAIIDVVLPAAVEESATVEQEQKPPEERKLPPKLNLTVVITKKGFIIAGYGGVLDVAGVCGAVSAPQPEEGGGMPKYIIPMKSDGSYDLECLQKNLIRVKEAYPEQFSVIILPEWDIKYQTIIDVMDVAREYKVGEAEQRVTRIMFPNPVLAAGVLR